MTVRTGFGGYLATWILTIFNFIFVVTGFGLIAVGIWLFIDSLSVDEPKFYLDRNLREPSIEIFLSLIVTVSGLVMCIPALFGCCGALFGRPCLLATYAVMVSCGLLMLVTGALALTMYGKETDRALRDTLTSSMISSFSSNSSDTGLTSQRNWENLFVTFKCCGVNNGSDFDDLRVFTNAEYRIPSSCCITQYSNSQDIPIDPNCPAVSTEKSYIKTGCYDAILDQLIGYRDLIGGLILALASAEIVLIISAAYLARNTNLQKTS